MAPQSTRRKGGRNGRDGFDLKKVLVWRPKQAEAPSQPSQEQHQETEALTKKQLDLCQQRYDDLMRTAEETKATVEAQKVEADEARKRILDLSAKAEKQEAKLAQMAQENLALKEAQSFADHLAGKNAELQQQLVDGQEQLKEQKKKEEDLVAQHAMETFRFKEEIAKLEAQIQSLKAPASGRSSETEAPASGASVETAASTSEERPKAPPQEELLNAKDSETKAPEETGPGESAAPAKPKSKAKPKAKAKNNKKKKNNKAEGEPDAAASPKIDAEGDASDNIRLEAQNLLVDAMRSGTLEGILDTKLKASDNIRLEAQNLLVDAMRSGTLEGILDTKLKVGKQEQTRSATQQVVKDLSAADQSKIRSAIQIIEADPKDALQIKVEELMLAAPDKNLDSILETMIKDLPLTEKNLKLYNAVHNHEDAFSIVPTCDRGYSEYWVNLGGLWLRPHSATWRSRGPHGGPPGAPGVLLAAI